MSRDPRYDILFEPVCIGPVTAKNRFYQVPHCSGMGFVLPQTLAAMRATKAQGGWGVVSTEYCSVHPSSDDAPYPYATLWDVEDVRSHQLMVDQVHAHGALAGVELWHGGGGLGSPNLLTRDVPLGLQSLPVGRVSDPVQSRAMDRSDIRELRRWYLAAARRAKEAGFDIIYLYACHGYLLDTFFSPLLNTRSDEYGGSPVNGVRLVRELIEETKEAVGDTCAVAVRFAADPGAGESMEERREMFSLLAELPDLWDITVQDYALEMGSSLEVKEGSLEEKVAYVKSLTTKPVVSVGRFTSPDTMVSQVRRGVIDLIGAARPSIADPYLPAKIEEGRIDDIRECIGCNICYSGDARGVPIRCTQNPTMGEEWRRGWHPEGIAAKASDEAVLVVGAGPADLEAARALGQRGYPVTLAEATDALGGRATAESRLPGLEEWARVRDYRVQQLQKMPNVEIYRASRLTAEDLLSFGFPRIALGTGAHWRRDGVGRWHKTGLTDLAPRERIYTPDDLLVGRAPEGDVLVYDDDHYYMAAAVAEKLRRDGHAVTLVTPESRVSAWSLYTSDQSGTQGRLIELGIQILVSHALDGFDGGEARLACVFSGRRIVRSVNSLMLVTARLPEDALYHQLTRQPDALQAKGIASVTRIGDCLAPGTLASAVYCGHRYARELDEPAAGDVPFRRERVTV
jgi:dimethylamine/trimethylamine dehydrogenase